MVDQEAVEKRCAIPGIAMHPCRQRCQAPSLTAPRVRQAPKPAVADPFAGVSAPSTATTASEATRQLLRAMEAAAKGSGQQPFISAAAIAAVPAASVALRSFSLGNVPF